MYTSKSSKNAVSLEDLMSLINSKCAVQEVQKNRIVEASKSLYLSGRGSDFKIIVDSKIFKVHKWVLEFHSPVLARTFESGSRDTQASEMNIHDLSAEAVENFLRFLYTGDMPDIDKVMDVFALSAKLNVPELRSICERIICEHILEQSSAYKIFVLGHAYNSESLKLSAFYEIKSMFPESELAESLIDHPEKIKELLEIRRNYVSNLKIPDLTQFDSKK